MPPSLYLLSCEDTEIRDLPVKFPRTLEHLYISRTNIKVLPILPAGLKTVHTGGTFLSVPWPIWPQPSITPSQYNKRAADVREAWLERRRPQERCAIIKMELMEKMWAPARVSMLFDRPGGLEES